MDIPNLIEKLESLRQFEEYEPLASDVLSFFSCSLDCLSSQSILDMKPEDEQLFQTITTRFCRLFGCPNNLTEQLERYHNLLTLKQLNVHYPDHVADMLQTLQEENTRLSDTLSTMKASELDASSLQAEKCKMQEQLDDLYREKTSLKNRLNQLSKENSSLRESYELLWKEYHQLIQPNRGGSNFSNEPPNRTEYSAAQPAEVVYHFNSSNMSEMEKFSHMTTSEKQSITKIVVGGNKPTSPRFYNFPNAETVEFLHTGALILSGNTFSCCGSLHRLVLHTKDCYIKDETFDGCTPSVIEAPAGGMAEQYANAHRIQFISQS